MANLIRSQSLFYEEPTITKFTATVTQVIPLPDGRYSVILDQTYFYPTGGGQEHDTGTINGSPVVDVLRDEDTGMVTHILENELQPGPAVCEIDWTLRLRNMQHHSGQHLLTQCVIRLFDLPTVSANINAYSPSTLDIVADRLLSDDELEQAEQLANQIIYENRPIHTYFVAPEEIEKIPLRRPPKVSENIRIVEIEGFDHSACGGTHCNQTGSIGILKVLKNERINNKTRLHFVAGQQALEIFRGYHRTMSKLATSLSTKPGEIEDSVQRLNEALKLSQKEIQAIKRENLAYEAQVIIAHAESIGAAKYVLYSFENRPAGELRLLADILKLQNDLVSILTSYDGQRLSVIVTCGQEMSLSATKILERMLMQFDGRGGGDQQIAQGGGAVLIDKLDRVLANGSEAAREMIQ